MAIRNINKTLKDKINDLCFYYPYVFEALQREGVLSKKNAETLVNWRIEQKRQLIQDWFFTLTYEEKQAFSPYFQKIENILTLKK